MSREQAPGPGGSSTVGSRTLVRNIGWVSLGQVVTTLLSVLKMAIAARVMIDETLGIYALLLLYAQLGYSLGGLEQSGALLHFRRLTDAQLNTLLYSSLVLTGLVSGLTILVGFFEFSEEYLGFLALLALSLLPRVIDEHYRALRLRDHEHRFNTRVLLGSTVLGNCFSIVGLLLDAGLAALVWGMLLQIGISAAWQSWSARSRFAERDYRTLAPLGELRDVWRFSAWQLAQRLLNLGSSRLDRAVILWGFGLGTLGAYELAVQLCYKPFLFVGNIVARIFAPVYAQDQAEPERINARYLDKLSVLVWLQLPIYAVMIWQAEMITELVYGPNWPRTALAIQALGVLGMAKAVSNPIGAYLVGLGRPDIGAYQNLIGLVGFGVLLLPGAATDRYELTLWLYAAGGALLTLAYDAAARWRVSRMPFWTTWRQLAVWSMLLAVLIALGELALSQADVVRTAWSAMLISSLVATLFLGVSYLSAPGLQRILTAGRNQLPLSSQASQVD